jgi:hypothetical protein
MVGVSDNDVAAAHEQPGGLEQLIARRAACDGLHGGGPRVEPLQLRVVGVRDPERPGAPGDADRVLEPHRIAAAIDVAEDEQVVADDRPDLGGREAHCLRSMTRTSWFSVSAT